MALIGGPMKATDLLVKALEKEKVKYVFGVPGEENLDFVESLRKSKIKLVVTRHEMGAGMMAATVGRLTGKAGVALSTLGPGATNLCTAAAYSNLGAFPMLMITGQKPVLKSKQGTFQIIDTVGLFAPLTKFNKQVVHGSLVAPYTREAFRQAEEERPGAAHIELPEDIAGEEVPEAECVVFDNDRVRRPIPDEKAIKIAVEAIKSAKHPMMVIGAGANRKLTCNMLRQFVTRHRMPFCDTQMGKGVIDSRHECYMGTAAISSGDYIHAAIEYSDLLLVVGHDLVEKPPFVMQAGDKRTVIHVNFNQANIDQVYFPHIEVVGDIANALWQMSQALEGCEPQWDLRYFRYIKQEMEAHLCWGVGCCDFPMTPPRIVALTRQILPEDALLCLDNGLYKVWFARQYKAYQQNTLLLDNALASMAAGVPSAIGAKLARPDQQVVACVGDGGLMMSVGELSTAVSLKLHITILIMNDDKYGMIRWKQEGMGFDDYGLDLVNPDFMKLADAFGCQGHAVRSADDFPRILQHCLEEPAVHLVDVPIDYKVTDNLQVPNLKKYLKETLRTPKEFEASPEKYLNGNVDLKSHPVKFADA